MNYVFNVTVAQNISRDLPQRLEISPLERMVCEVQAKFPSNAADKVGVRLLDRNMRFYPSTLSQASWVMDTGVTVVWRDDSYSLVGPSYLLALEVFNENAAASCIVEVRVTVVNATLLQTMFSLVQHVRALVARLAPGALEQP